MTTHLNDTDVMVLAINDVHDDDNDVDVNDTIEHNEVGLDVEVVNKINEQVNNKDKEQQEEDKEDTTVLNESIDVDDLMLSTIDNPYNPKTEYDMWKDYDVTNGHNTEEYIARLVLMESAYEIDDEFQMNVVTSKVINDIMENDTLEIYYLV